MKSLCLLRYLHFFQYLYQLLKGCLLLAIRSQKQLLFYLNNKKKLQGSISSFLVVPLASWQDLKEWRQFALKGRQIVIA